MGGESFLFVFLRASECAQKHRLFSLAFPANRPGYEIFSKFFSVISAPLW